MKKIDTEKIKKALGTEESKRILLAHTARNRNNVFISGVAMVLMLLLTAIVFIQIVKEGEMKKRLIDMAIIIVMAISANYQLYNSLLKFKSPTEARKILMSRQVRQAGGLSKKEMKRPDPDARAEFFGEKQPTGYMTTDFGGKFGSVSKAQQRKAVSRSERLQMARFKNARKKST